MGVPGVRRDARPKSTRARAKVGNKRQAVARADVALAFDEATEGAMARATPTKTLEASRP